MCPAPEQNGLAAQLGAGSRVMAQMWIHPICSRYPVTQGEVFSRYWGLVLSSEAPA